MNNPCIDCLTFPMCRQRIIIKLKNICRFPHSRYFEFYMLLAVKYKGCDKLFNYFKKEVSEVGEPVSAISLPSKINQFITEMNMDKEIKGMIPLRDLTTEDINKRINNPSLDFVVENQKPASLSEGSRQDIFCRDVKSVRKKRLVST